MAEDNIQELMDRLVADEELRERFRSDPVEVVERHGIELDDDQRERLRSADLRAVSDEELQARCQSGDWEIWF